MNSIEPVRRRIPALWVVIGVPLATVLASIVTVTMAFRESEPELPAQYPWEGAALDQDLARAGRAHELGAAADLHFAADGAVVVRVRLETPQEGLPAQLELQATHVTQPEKDRAWTLVRGSGDEYRATGAELGPGPWLLQLSAPDWRLRGRLDVGRAALHLGAPAPAAEAS